MSVRVMSAVWDSTIQPTASRFVLLALADNANDAGLCKPGINHLAGKTGLSRATVYRALSDLEAGGLIERRERTRDNGSQTTSAYRINLSELRGRSRGDEAVERDELADLFDGDGGSHRETPPSEQGSHGESGGVAPGDGEGRTVRPLAGRTVRPPEPSLQPPVEPSGEPLLVETAGAAVDQQAVEPPREDVEQLCERLKQRMVENECKPPTITKAWRDEARRLIDLDKRDPAEALRLIDWCQADSFWRSNILSIPKFRKQYDALLLKARDTAAWRLATPPGQRGAMPAAHEWVTEAWR